MMDDKSFWVTSNGRMKAYKGAVKETLPHGMYELNVEESMFGTEVFLTKMDVTTDTITNPPGSLCEYVIGMIEKFWKSKDRYTKMGLLYKRGILLEGVPGTGKTVLCLLLGQEIAKRGGISVFTSPSTNIDPLAGILASIRDSHPKTPLVNIIEDIDRQADDHIDSILPMLDGENQVENILHIATTNYVDELDDRLINRPSRFDEVINVVSPNKQAREAYLKTVLPEDANVQEFGNIVRYSEGLNFAQLKELAISIYVYDRDYREVILRLQGMEEKANEAKAKRERRERERNSLVVMSGGLTEKPAKPRTVRKKSRVKSVKK